MTPLQPVEVNLEDTMYIVTYEAKTPHNDTWQPRSKQTNEPQKFVQSLENYPDMYRNINTKEVAANVNN